VADVFISYSKSRRAEAAELAADLEGRGFAVWWDKDIAPGETFRDVITAELADARAAIVIWTPASVKSNWVISEASRAQKRGILIAVCSADLNHDDIPPPFDVIHTELVTNLPAILGALAKMGVSPSKTVPAVDDNASALPKSAGGRLPPKTRHMSRRAILVGGGTLSVGAAALGLALFRGEDNRPESAATRTLPSDGGGWVTSVAFTTDGRSVVSGSWDSSLRLWDVAAAREIRRFEGHEGVVWCVTILADGRHALSAGQDGTLKLWDLTLTRPIRNFKGHEKEIWSVAILPDGKRALSGSLDATLKLWDLSDEKVLRTIPCESRIFSVSVSPDGQTAVAAAKGALQSWNLADGARGRSFEGHDGDAKAVIVMPNGRHMLSGSDDTSLRLWDLSNGQEVRRFSRHEGPVLSVAVSSNGRTMLSGSLDRTAKLWDMSAGRVIRSFEEHTDSVEAVAIAPNGRTAVSAGRDKTIRVWDLSGAGS
jgi:WD40 repeat protein